MPKKQLTEEFRVKVVKEALETGEHGLVARRHDIHPATLSRWVNNYKKYGKTTVSKQTSKTTNKDVKSHILEKENDRLKRLLGEKELEIQILRDLLKKTNRDLEID